MSAYQTLVVGTDGSDTSLRAVEHAAAFAAENNARLIIAMAHLPTVDKGGWAKPARPDRVIDGRAEVTLGAEGDYKMHGSAPVYAILREARDRARVRPICWWLATWDWPRAATSGLARCPATSRAGPRPTC